ncbi:uncharacterized protein NEMAJ01_0845 [Nematocida major]|uniref:uncharacterized protein n=1 Tax=Nematocida major TaxID=1912982 RepID=UPI002007383A|nr:uncharacterized protein NEMAJ01_0845 [Nematocida major]KAH9385949.1 hypothetical protein NEMAJ01_0845 [Nematocida major]
MDVVQSKYMLKKLLSCFLWIFHKLHKNVALLSFIPVLVEITEGTWSAALIISLICITIMKPSGIFEFLVLAVFMAQHSAQILAYFEDIHENALFEFLLAAVAYCAVSCLVISLVKSFIVQPLNAVFKVHVKKAQAADPESNSHANIELDAIKSLAPESTPLESPVTNANLTLFRTGAINDSMSTPIEIQVDEMYNYGVKEAEEERACFATGHNVTVKRALEKGSFYGGSFTAMQCIVYSVNFVAKLLIIIAYYTDLYRPIEQATFFFATPLTFILLLLITQMEIVFYSIDRPLKNYTHLITILVVHFIACIISSGYTSKNMMLCGFGSEEAAQGGFGFIQRLCKVKNIWPSQMLNKIPFN